jgi:hypothetical protein
MNELLLLMQIDASQIPWSAIGFGLANLAALLGFWGSTAARLARIELRLEDVRERAPEWCLDQRDQCRRDYEPREPTGVRASPVRMPGGS